MTAQRVTPRGTPVDEEWEFSRLHNSDPVEIEAACWWEYLRASDRVRGAVFSYRSTKSFILPENLEPVRDIIGAMTASTLAFHVQEFPATPWLSIEEARKPFVRSVILDWLAKPAWITADAISVSRNELDRHGACAGSDVQLPILGGSTRARGTSRRSILLTVNWEANDEQIVETVAEWLRKNRPDALPNKKRRPRLSGANRPFPAQFDDALNWLGYQRLFLGLGSWTAVADEIGANDADAPERIRKLAGKARKIIRWIESRRPER